MVIYLLTIASALVVAVGEVVQQRSAAEAPAEYNLSVRLLLWLVRRPRWLGGLLASSAGNGLFATAVGRGNVALVEAVFVVRLLFAVVIAVLWGRHRVPARDLLGSLSITAGLIAFLLAGHPSKPTSGQVSDLRWLIGGGSVVAVALVLTVFARRLSPVAKAAVLGVGAGSLFGLQASLTQSAIHILSHAGLIAMLVTWNGYAVAAVAVGGMLLMQSAFAAAPLTASYPTVVTAELISGIGIGIVVLGGSVHMAPTNLAIGLAGLLVMVGGIYLLTTSPLVTGQLDELVRRQDIGEALRIEQRLSREVRRADRILARVDPLGINGSRRARRRLEREVGRIDAGINRLCGLQEDIRRHRQAEAQRLADLPHDEQQQMAESHRALMDRERVIEEHARGLQEQVDAVIQRANLHATTVTNSQQAGS